MGDQNTIRYVVPNDLPEKHPDETQISKAFDISSELYNKIGAKNVIFLVESKQHFPDRIVESVFGQDFCRKLIKANGGFAQEEPFFIALHSSKTIRKSNINYEIIIAYNAYDKMLECTNDLPCKAIIAIPFSMGSINNWRETWPYINTLNNEEHTLKKTNVELEEVIKFLSNRPTLKLSIRDPSMMSLAEEKFNDLYEKKIYPTCKEIEKSAIRNGWQTKRAKELGVKFGKG